MDKIRYVKKKKAGFASSDQAAAPAGGSGQTAGAYDSAAHRDTAIALLNAIRTALVEAGIMKGAA